MTRIPKKTVASDHFFWPTLTGHQFGKTKKEASLALKPLLHWWLLDLQHTCKSTFLQSFHDSCINTYENGQKSRYYNSLKEIFFEELSMEKTLWPKRSWFDFLLSIEHWQWLCSTCLSCQVGFSIRKCCHRHLFRESDWSSWNKRENMSSIDSSSCSRRRKNLQLLLPHILRSFLSDWVPLFRWATNWPERELNGQFEVKAV